MKKNLLLLLTACAILCAAGRTEARGRYQGELYSGFSVASSADPVYCVPVRLVNSLRIGEYFSAGIGVGLDFHLRKKELAEWYYDGSGGLEEGRQKERSIPVYLNLKGYIPSSRLVSFFGSVDLGRTIGAWALKRQGGFMFTPSVGVSWRLSMGTAITFGLGYTVQRWTYKPSGTGDKESVNRNTFNFNVGFRF